MSLKREYIFVLLLATAFAVGAEQWTNQAGQVIEARLESFDGAWISLIRSNGTTIKMPISALSSNDQQRVRQVSGASMTPDFVKAAYQDARKVLDRFDGLPAQQRTESARQKAVHMACSVFDSRVSQRHQQIHDPAAQAEIQKLRTRLVNHGKAPAVNDPKR